MRLSDPFPLISTDDVHRERARSPMARQLCHGSMQQLMVDAESTVDCPHCLKSFSTFDTQKNRDRVHPIIPSHLADAAGVIQVEIAKMKHRKSDTPRPY